MAEVTHYQYQVGGSLPTDAATYVVREADITLFNALLAGDYCYILDARQMGKSSLRARTMKRLRQQGIVSTEIELSGIGSQEITAHQWYGGIIWELVSGFSLALNRRQWLREHDHLSPVQRLGTFIDTVLLTQVTQPIVIFFDEIDYVLGLEFPTDDFFAMVRHWFEKRSVDQRYRRLSIVLLGAASPSNLIYSNAISTPFNIGRAISLSGFQPHEVSPLAEGFIQDVNNPRELLNIILDWTGGQPFLTQKLCRLVRQQLDQYGASASTQNCDSTAELLRTEELRSWVANLVKEQVIDYWETQDEPDHLRTIRDRLLHASNSKKQRLTLYQKILTEGSVPVRQKQTEHMELSLTGVVMRRSGEWIVKNPIYRAIFNPTWVAQALTESSITAASALPPATKTPGLYTWARIALVTLLTTSLTLGLRLTGALQPWELKAFDQLMQLRPQESPDPRLLIIEITEADVNAQTLAERGASSLSDQTLNQLRLKLELAQPRTIGLDIYREQAVRPDYGQLTRWMETNKRFFAICNYGNPGVSPPPELPLARHGFNNVLKDADGISRRYPLAVSDSSPCQNAYALSWLLATHYLESEGLTSQITSDGYLQLGNIVFKPLLPQTGGYQFIDSRGHQIMINYRATETVAETITLDQFLSNPEAIELARDRIVLIGTSAPSFNDHRWLTPHSQRMGSLVPLSGIEIQAHMVSQILSATLNQRPLIWSWPQALETLWIASWAIIGSLITKYGHTRWSWLIALGIALAILVGICWQALLLGGWLPLIPGGLTLLVCSTSVSYFCKGPLGVDNESDVIDPWEGLS